MPTTIFVILLLSVVVQAAPPRTNHATDLFTLPKNSPNYDARAAGIEEKRRGWLYKEFPIGGAFYPTGTLANETISEQQARWFPTVIEHASLIAEESEAALAGIIAVRKTI